MKAVMISIRPEWVDKIISGEKTIEVRKTAPKIETPFKCFIYCTKDEKYKIAPFRFVDGWHIKHYDNSSHYANGCTANVGETLNGKVIGEFVCDSIQEFTWSEAEYRVNHIEEEKMCLNQVDLINYGKGKPLYGLYISNLEIYDKPKEIGKFRKVVQVYCKTCFGKRRIGGYCSPGNCLPLTRPPQSWCYVEYRK